MPGVEPQENDKRRKEQNGTKIKNIRRQGPRSGTNGEQENLNQEYGLMKWILLRGFSMKVLRFCLTERMSEQHRDSARNNVLIKISCFDHLYLWLFRIWISWKI